MQKSRAKDGEIRKLASLERQDLGKKEKEFEKRGKAFRANPYSGIVPQDIYDALRDPKDDKFRLSKKPTKAELRKIADGDRVYPVKYFVIHHSVGPEFRDMDHNTIAQWYSDVGKSRAYAGVAHSGHYFNGRETFASNHLVGHWHNNVWCIFHIIDDYWNAVSWGAGNWKVNQQAINIENCGRFTSSADDKILRSLADWWRPQHRALGNTSLIVPHREVSLTGTACPERLGDQIPTIRTYLDQSPTPPPMEYNFVAEIGKARVAADGDDLFILDAPRLSGNIKSSVADGTEMDYVGYVTNGDNVEGSTKWWKNAYNSYFSEKYCKKIEAPAPPPPTPPTPSAPAIKYEPLELPIEYQAKTDAKLWNFNHAKLANMNTILTKKAGDKVMIVAKALHPTGSVYLMTGFSYNNSGQVAVPHQTAGFNEVDMEVVRPAPPPEPTPPTPPAPEPAPAPEPEPEPDRNAIIAFLKSIQKLITEFLGRFK